MENEHDKVGKQIEIAAANHRATSSFISLFDKLKTNLGESLERGPLTVNETKQSTEILFKLQQMYNGQGMYWKDAYITLFNRGVQLIQREKDIEKKKMLFLAWKMLLQESDKIIEVMLKEEEIDAV